MCQDIHQSGSANLSELFEQKKQNQEFLDSFLYPGMGGQIGGYPATDGATGINYGSLADDGLGESAPIFGTYHETEYPARGMHVQQQEI